MRPSGVRGFGCLGEVSQLFSFGFLLHQGPQVFLGETFARTCQQMMEDLPLGITTAVHVSE